MSKTAAAVRAAAADAAVAVVPEGRSLDAALAQGRAALPPSQHSLFAHLAYGVLRHWRALEFFAAALMDKPLPAREQRLQALLLVGLFQLWQARIPAHAAVQATVGATRVLQRGGLRGLVNAVLRNFDRRQAALLEALADPAVPMAVRESHPDWLAGMLATDWPGQHQAILAANNARAPMWLRVNTRHGSRADYLERLVQVAEAAAVHPAAAGAIRLASPLPVGDLPGFAAGDVSVQDLAPQLVAEQVAAAPGMRVLDACAAPGGKAAHLQELADNQLDLTAIDIDATRLERVRETFARLQLDADIRAGDATAPDDWWDGQPFDRIVIDAPCSATGVIRRHPDIKHLRRATDIPSLAARQLTMLQALWPLLAKEGCLVFATCSVLRAENDAVIEQFCQETPDVMVDPELRVDNNNGVMTVEPWGLSVLPGSDDADGFFITRLVHRRRG